MDQPEREPFWACRTVRVREMIEIRGFDLNDCDFGITVRDRPGGTVVITLLKTNDVGVKGVRLVNVDSTTNPYPVSYLEFCIPIDSTGLGAVPMAAPGEPDAVELFWDMLVRPQNNADFRPFEGPFYVRSGATQL